MPSPIHGEIHYIDGRRVGMTDAEVADAQARTASTKAWLEESRTRWDADSKAWADKVAADWLAEVTAARDAGPTRALADFEGLLHTVWRLLRVGGAGERHADMNAVWIGLTDAPATDEPVVTVEVMNRNDGRSVFAVIDGRNRDASEAAIRAARIEAVAAGILPLA